ncbi:MAG: efflux RND transporter periplasmic adaptor subunit [Terriglobia bacterium]
MKTNMKTPEFGLEKTAGFVPPRLRPKREASAPEMSPLRRIFPRSIRQFAAIALLLWLLLILISGCGRSNSPAEADSTQSAAPAGTAQASYFTVPQDEMQHLQIVTVSRSSIAQVLRFPASVSYNLFATTPVITQVGGPVSRVLVFPGQTVRAGQPMLEVTSPDYAQMRDSYVKARDAYDLAGKNLHRSEDLYAHHAISTSALEQAQSASVQAQADMTAATQALRVLGFSNPQQVLQKAVSPLIPLRAPVSGEVVERTVSPGQVVQAGSTQCFVISNMSKVWVLANVYQNDLQYVHVGDPVTIQTDAYPQLFHGRISYLAPAMDPNTRTLQVRIVTANPRQKLKKDMYVTAIVNAGALKNALTVPDSAVLRSSENQPFVYVSAEPQKFAQRLITIGDTQGGRTQVLSGLKPGEQVVANGSLFLQFANSFQR